MKIKDIQKNAENKRTAMISSRVKPKNKRWFMKNEIDLDSLIEELKKKFAKVSGDEQK